MPETDEKTKVVVSDRWTEEDRDAVRESISKRLGQLKRDREIMNGNLHDQVVVSRNQRIQEYLGEMLDMLDNDPAYHLEANRDAFSEFIA